MIVGQVIKQPSEQFPIAIDFSDRTPVGDSVLSGVVTAAKRSDGSDATGDVLTGSAGISDNIVAQEVTEGESLTEYVVTFKATTLFGRVLEDELLLVVSEQP